MVQPLRLIHHSTWFCGGQVRHLVVRLPQGTDTAYLLLYVDDIVLTASSQLLRRVISGLQQEFSMKDLGELHHFLGMHVQRSGAGLLLSQR